MDGGRIGQSNSGASSSSSKSNALGKMGRFFKRMVKHTTSSRSKRSEVSSAAQAPEKDSEMPSLESRNAAKPPKQAHPITSTDSTISNPSFNLSFDNLRRTDPAEAELKRDLPSSKDLGIPEDPAQWCNEDCRTFLKDGVDADWFAMHANFKETDPEGKAVLSRMVDYRKEYVMGVLKELKQENPGLQAFSGGSTNLTSDFDITIALEANEEGLKEDVRVAEKFNARIQSDFENPSGIVFDTNLYMQDYLAVKGNLPLTAGEVENQAIQPVGAPKSGKQRSVWLADQDIMSLMKQRRFMDQRGWNMFVENLLDGIEDSAVAEDVKQRYEEADTRYRDNVKSVLSSLDAKGITGLGSEQDLSTEDSSVMRSAADVFQRGTDPLVRSRARAIIEEELVNSIKMRKALHDNPADMLDIFNDHYIASIKKARSLEQELVRLPEGSDREDELKAEIKRAIGQSAFYAIEAYHTGGALTHVVAGSQSGRLEEVLGHLDPQQLLHSHNEQLGDLIKEIGHYSSEGASSGELAYRSSKYFSRLLESVILLRKKGALEGELPFEQEYGSIEDLKAKVDAGLVKARSGVTSFDSSAKKDAYALKELRGLLKINRYENVAPGYQSRVLGLAAEVNAAVRNSKMYQETLTPIVGYRGSLMDQMLDQIDLEA
tara:strand:- start:14642 stop:16618 length:1977 start_codon:yes stop_codon:yes gene_type:complete